MKVKNHYDDHEVLHQQPVEDRRGAQRELTVYRVVKVDRDGEESLARCRNISDTGMKLDLRLPVVLNDELQIELAPGTVLSARVVWTNGEQCGVAFDQSVDCRTVLEDSSSELRSGRGRQPRVNAQLPARIL
ncbi:MAG: PilZ domain-containing protein, partial [Verrucomicrobiaceae bacterium]